MNALNNVKYYFKSRAQKALVRLKKKPRHHPTDKTDPSSTDGGPWTCPLCVNTGVWSSAAHNFKICLCTIHSRDGCTNTTLPPPLRDWL